MCGLLILKHLRNVSDETVVLQWSENAYYQYFCGQLEFTPKEPCDASDLVHFRKRIGEKGMGIMNNDTVQKSYESSFVAYKKISVKFAFTNFTLKYSF